VDVVLTVAVPGVAGYFAIHLDTIDPTWTACDEKRPEQHEITNDHRHLER
jgi:hypothetical protein